MNMTEPCSTGIGGDMFILYWDAAQKKVHAMNGSGRSGAHCTLDAVRKSLGIPDGQVGQITRASAHSVTVPGAPAGWVDTVERFGSGKVDLSRILKPAIRLGEEGFPVSEIAAAAVGPRRLHCGKLLTGNSGSDRSRLSAARRRIMRKCSRKTEAKCVLLVQGKS